jgi:hypothetical protein
MTKYQKFLEQLGVISEENFNKIAEFFPQVSIDSLDFSEIDTYYDMDNADVIAKVFVTVILNAYEWAYVEDINFNTKTISLWDVQSLEDLEKIKEELSEWTIENEEELKEEILESEREEKMSAERAIKVGIIENVIDNIPIEELREFVKDYDNKG